MDFVSLLGTEDVRSAGHEMTRAAEVMRGAAGDIHHALTQHQEFMWQWLAAFEVASDRPEKDEEE